MGLRFGNWLGHSRTLICFFLSYSFVALVVCFGSLSCWNTHPRPVFNALAGFNALTLMVHGPVHRPIDAVQLSCSLSRKKLQSIMFLPTCLTVGMVFLGFLRSRISVLHGIVCYPLLSLVTMVPASLRSLTRSSRVVLG